jgi:DNA repair exonuclease SbcCD nuclease subunit
MILVATSDWHTDRKTLGVDRYDDVRQAAHQSVDYAIRARANLWAFLGDLCDPEDGYEVARGTELSLEIALRLRGAKISSFWIAGNHCPYENGLGRTVLSPLRALASDADNKLHLFEEPGSRVFDFGSDQFHVIALPYPPVSRSFDLADACRAELTKPRRDTCATIVLAHATYIPGAVEGEETLEMPRGRAVPLPVDVIPKGARVLNGHYHTPQVTPGGVLIPGAPARLTKGEAKNEPRFIVLDL